MKLEPGQTLSHYRLVEKLGHGGMGAVWKAQDEKLRRGVALKFILPELLAKRHHIQRFLREARLEAAVNHPNIATVYEVDEVQGQVFLVMELVEGTTLRSLLETSPLPISSVFQLATEIAEGLAFAHQAGIIHRDLKPENIMVRPDGHVKILDFGLARLRQPESPADDATSDAPTFTGDLTRGGMLLGTPAYMSPEQARCEVVDARSDIFSFGVILFEMATGSAPFRAGSTIETLHAILRDPTPQVSRSNPSMPHALTDVVSRCLEKDPADRYGSTEELLADLRELRRASESGTPYPVRIGWRGWLPAAVVAVLIAAGVALYYQGGRDGSPTTQQVKAVARDRIVVLPFDNLGPATDEFFAAGITEEISSRLARFGGLSVISWKSAQRYEATEKTTREIGEELDVDWILEGTVQWARGTGAANRVRITPKLIRVADDTQAWADSYDRVIDDIFEIQSGIAEAVSGELGVALGEGEREEMRVPPTSQMRAYEAYLQGLHHARRADQVDDEILRAVEKFQLAVELDPDFAVAYAELGRAHSLVYHLGIDRTYERQELSRLAIERALELAPGLPQALLAHGYYFYHCHRDYDRALERFELAGEHLTNSVDLLEGIAYVRRRQGQWDRVVSHLQRALELDPLDDYVSQELALTLDHLHRYEEALRHYDRSILLAPGEIYSYLYKARCLWRWKGTAEESRRVLDEAPSSRDAVAIAYRFWQDVYQGDYQRALTRMQTASFSWMATTYSVEPTSLLAAFALEQLGDEEAALSAYVAARDLTREELRRRPDDFRLHSALGLALAGLGEREEARRAGRRAVELYPIADDAFAGSWPILYLALIETRIGEHDAALDRIESLLAMPSGLSPGFLRLDPRWQPLREHPRFRQLLGV